MLAENVVPQKLAAPQKLKHLLCLNIYFYLGIAGHPTLKSV